MDAETAVWARLTPAPSDLEAPVPIDELWRQAIELLEGCSSRGRVVERLIGVDIGKLPPSYERMGEITAQALAVVLQDFVGNRVLSLYVLRPSSNRFYRLPRDGLVSPARGVTSYCGQDTNDRAAQTAEYSWANGELHRTSCPEWLWPLGRHRIMTTSADAAAVLEHLRIIMIDDFPVAGLSERSEADAIFGSEVWRDRSRWPRDDHRLRDTTARPVVFVGRAIDDRLARFAPPEKERNEARLWAGELTCNSARAGNLRTSLDHPNGESFLAGSGNPAFDRARCNSILAACGVRNADGGWVPLFIDAADLDWLVGELRSQAAPPTPFEVEEKQREASAAELVQRLPYDREWELFVTILWIGSRAFPWMAPYIVASQTIQRSTFESVSAGGLVSWAKACLEQLPEVIERNPEMRLLSQLTAGTVWASGLETGVGPRRRVPREQWLDLRFPRAGPKDHDGLCCAYAGDPDDPHTHFWSRLAFDSVSVMEAFPPKASELLSATIARAESWRVGPGEAQCKWILRPAVLTEAKRRWDGKSRASLARVFEVMAAPERTWKEANLLAAMKTTGQFPAPARLQSKTPLAPEDKSR